MPYERIMGLNVTDDQEYQLYREGMVPILTTYGGRFIYDFKIAEVLISASEADINRVFSIQFPSKEAMESFFSDPHYIEVKNQHFNKSVKGVTVISMHEKTD